MRIDNQRVKRGHESLATVRIEVEVLPGARIELREYREAEGYYFFLDELLHDGLDETAGCIQDFNQATKGG